MKWRATLQAAIALTVTQTLAMAFCRSTTCDPTVEFCARDEAGCETTGVPLYWPGRCIGWGVQASGSQLRGISADTLAAVIESSFSEWRQAACGDATPAFEVAPYDELIVCDESVYNKRAKNANVWMFQDVVWPYDRDENVIGLTTTIFAPDTGEIYDADVELNSRDYDFFVDSDAPRSTGALDLVSTVTHEAGHFLGLGHSSSPEATMVEGYTGVAARSLNPDDMAGICAVFPPESPAKTCSFQPRHGFSVECSEPMDDAGGCGCRTSPDRSGTVPAAFSLLALAVLRRARRAAADGASQTTERASP
jgi:MYXO-CTERM domain-containing protein